MPQRVVNGNVCTCGGTNYHEAIQLEPANDRIDVFLVVLSRQVVADLAAGHTKAARIEVNQLKALRKTL
jgi:hypothetical protein